MEYEAATPMDRAEVIARLRDMPQRLRAARQRTGSGGTHRRAGADEWTAREAFDHIRATDVLHSAQIFLLVCSENPALPGADERALAEYAGFAADALETALMAYAIRRGELVRLLERLDDAAWQRAGMHPAWGRTTIERYARHIFAHEAEHLEQIEHLLRAAR